MQQARGGRTARGLGSSQEGPASKEEVTGLRALKAALVRSWRQGKYCDVTLTGRDGEEVLAHKVLLAAQSTTFARLLDGQKEEETGLAVKEVGGDVLRVVVEYLYSGKMKPNLVTRENAKEMLTAGEMFDIEDVKEEAAIFMAKHLDEENAIDVMTKDIFVGAVSNNAFTYVANNFQLFLASEPLKKRLLVELGTGQLCHLLRQKGLMLWDKAGIYLPALEREKLLFFLVMSYVAHDKAGRLPDLGRLLTCLRLPLLAVGKVLSVAVMAQGLGEKPEELAGQLAQVLEPFEELGGQENLCTLFAERGKLEQAERRMLADTCRMRYATVPHSTSCSDLAPASNPHGPKQVFSPGPRAAWAGQAVGQRVRGLTVLRADLGAEQGAEDGAYRVCGLRLRLEGETEETVGLVDHPTLRKGEEHILEDGEFIVEVITHHTKSDLLKGDTFKKEIHSLTNISDLSFTTNKGRSLGPGPAEETEPELGPGLHLSLPGKLRHLEKNCPGKFHCLAGFGLRTVQLADTRPKQAFHPVWAFQTHFRVHPAKEETFQFVSGVKKHYQYSVDGLAQCVPLDEAEDIQQVERSPVHEVVELESGSESGSEGSGDSEEEMQPGLLPRGMGGPGDDSVMVLDSDSGEEDEERFEEEDEDDDEDVPRGPGAYWPGPGAGWKGQQVQGRGGADEPIEIESSSEEDEPGEAPSTSRKGTNGNGVQKLKELPPINGIDPNLNLSEDSSEEETEDKSSENTNAKDTNSNSETEQAKKRKLEAAEGGDGKKACVS